MFQCIIHAPVAVFDVNPIGRILNRFTKDIAIMDGVLPDLLSDFLHFAFYVLGSIALVGWVNPWSLIAAVLAFGAMVFVRSQFVQCLRDLRRLEGITRSPIYSHLTSSIYGLKVIRSYRAERKCSDLFRTHLDLNNRANYLIVIVSRWAGLRFDWIACCLFALIILPAMIVRVVGNKLSAADISLTFSYGLNLVSLLQWAVRLSIDCETQMTAVERVIDYCSLEQEPPAEVPPEHRPPEDWPVYGKITFDDVSMSHSTAVNAPLALKHISVTIEANEKVGIVGRTGAGKTSFVETLFRMRTSINGQIKIDNIDINTIGLDDVRRRISIIPQDPVLFTGTIKNNLDLLDEYADDEIWHALEEVKLKKLVAEGMSAGLQSEVNENGSNLSVGQKQLICLARAILKKSKILVMDEATANVDHETDELIQRTIRGKFKQCTVLTVAHRLQTVIDCHRIMVLDHGELLEFNAPHVLLNNPNSHLSSLASQLGQSEFDYLRQMANLLVEQNNNLKSPVSRL